MSKASYRREIYEYYLGQGLDSEEFIKSLDRKKKRSAISIMVGGCYTKR
jgi:hypothetical protein